MLIKSWYSFDPTDELHCLGRPMLADHPEKPAGKDGNGANGGQVTQAPSGDAFVFKSTPAMQILNIPANIPERLPSMMPMSSSPMMLSSNESPKASPWRWPIALIVSTCIVVVGFLVYQQMNMGNQPAVTSENVAISSTASNAATNSANQAPAVSTEVKTAKPTEQPAAATENTATDKETEKEKETASAAKHEIRRPLGQRQSKGASPKGAAAESSTAEAAAAPSVAAAQPGKKRDELDSLIEKAVGTKMPDNSAPMKSKKETASESGAAALTPEQIRSTMDRIKPQVQSCYDQYQEEGRADVRLTITPDGTVSNAVVKGKFENSMTGMCVQSAVRKAKFPAFGGKAMTISYPFLLQ